MFLGQFQHKGGHSFYSPSPGGYLSQNDIELQGSPCHNYPKSPVNERKIDPSHSFSFKFIGLDDKNGLLFAERAFSLVTDHNLLNTSAIEKIVIIPQPIER